MKLMEGKQSKEKLRPVGTEPEFEWCGEMFEFRRRYLAA